MSNKLRWACICAVFVVLANSSRPLFADDSITYTPWTNYDDVTGSGPGRTVWEHRWCMPRTGEIPDDSGLMALVEVTEAGSEQIGFWSAGPSGTMGGRQNHVIPGTFGCSGDWHADLYAGAGCSGNAWACAEADALVLLTVDGGTIWWEFCSLRVEKDHGTRSTSVVWDYSSTPYVDYESTAEPSPLGWVIDGHQDDPIHLLGVELQGWTTAFCDIQDENATGYGLAKITNCVAHVDLED